MNEALYIIRFLSVQLYNQNTCNLQKLNIGIKITTHKKDESKGKKCLFYFFTARSITVEQAKCPHNVQKALHTLFRGQSMSTTALMIQSDSLKT